MKIYPRRLHHIEMITKWNLFGFVILLQHSINVHCFDLYSSLSTESNNTGLFELNSTLTLTGVASTTLPGHANTTLPYGEEDYPKDMVRNLVILCLAFEVGPENCTCELFDPGDEDEEPVCEFLARVEKGEKRNIFTLYNHLYAVITLFSAIIGTLGNSLVIAIAIFNFLHNQELPNCKLLIAYLAVCDFIFAILNLFISIPKFWTTEWLYGKTLCKIMLTFEDLGSYLAVGIILLITIERYIGIVNPFKKGLSKSILRYILLINILVGVISIIPPLVFYDISNTGQCQRIWTREEQDSVIYDIVIMVFYFAIPFQIIAGLYIVIICELRRKTELVTDCAIADPRLRRRRFQETKRTVYILVTVVVIFAILVFPKHVIYIYFDIKGWSSEKGPENINKDFYFALLFTAYLPYPLHVAVNPVIYSLIDKRWRKDLKYFIFKMERPRASSTTAQSSLQSRRRSSPYLNGIESIAVKNSPRVFIMSYHKSGQDFGTCGLNNINRKQHMSDSSSKSIESEATAASEYPETFEP